jgi:hypothetical protein
MPNALAIDWSVWQRNPVVSWVWEGASACVIFQKPPLAVCPLATLGKMAIVGDFEECGPENLLSIHPLVYFCASIAPLHWDRILSLAGLRKLVEHLR